MRRILLATIALAALLIVGAATSSVGKDRWSFGWGNKRNIKGSGVPTTVERKVEGFDKIDVALPVNLDVTVGPVFKLTMTCDDNVVDLISTRVRGRTLVFDFKESFSTREDISIVLTMPKLTELSVGASGDISVTGLSGEEFMLDIAGSADIECSGTVSDLRVQIDGSGDANFVGLNADRVELEVNGSGDIQLSGAARELNVEIPGSGDIDARDLKCQEVTASISGSGNIDCFAESSLDGNISGSGDIRYWGNPGDVNRDISGHGRITRKS